MVLPLVCVLVFPVAIVFIVRSFYLTVFKNGKRPEKIVRNQPVKTLIVLGSGGHTTEILRIVQQLNKKNYTPRIYVQAKTDQISSKKVNQLEADAKDYRLIEISRSREVRQSYLTSILTTVFAILQSIPIIWREKPDLLLCNGPGTCIPLCLKAFAELRAFHCQEKFYITWQIIQLFSGHILMEQDFPGVFLYNNIAMMLITPKYIQWDNLCTDLNEHSPSELKFHLNKIFTRLRNFDDKKIESSSTKKLKSSLEWVNNDLLATEACLDRIWEMLNSGYWKDVPVDYRYSYSLCSVFKSMLLEILINSESNEMEIIKKFNEIIQQIDKGILLGAPLPNSHNLLTNIASELNQHFLNINKSNETSNEIKINKEDLCTTIFSGFESVAYFTKPSMETFYCKIFQPKTPALLKGCIEHWSALTKWKDANYLYRVAGNRTVPIEIGSRYTEDDWTQSLVTFSDFLKNHISKKNDKVGYLAQHQLFDQIPELKSDFCIPDYCSFSDKEDSDDTPDINAWFGPKGTVSPLHYDPKNNLLCQVFGYKRIILYSPDDNINLYPYESRLLCNTAKVDPYNPDFENYPNFKRARGYMCFLKPGDMLFIPPKWWHHVVGLSSSFSISFWWD